MLNKTAMAMIPAAWLVGAAVLAPTATSAHSGESGFIAVNFPYCEENPWDSQCRGDPPAHSRAKERS
jgi:hypothetical protein